MMRKNTGGPRLTDNDAGVVRSAARAVGVQITVCSSILVLAVLVAAFAFVFANVSPSFWSAFGHHHETTIDVGASDILFGGTLIGIIAIALAGTISAMATHRAVRPLALALRAQRAFVSDASHELRTPLTVLDARLQLLQRGLAEDDPSVPIVASLRRDTKGLIAIVNDLLAAAELNGTSPAARNPVPVNPVVELAVDSMRLIAEAKSVTLTVFAPENLATYLPAGPMSRCLVALLDNALNYSPHDGTISVSLRADRGTVVLAVRDQGPGIQGVDPSRIFDRFVRSSTSIEGGGATGIGFGIGLSLVRDSVESIGGRAFVSDTSANGTEITLFLPKAYA
ncbi:MAG: two-component system, OmpR family, sensor kinase [Actinomycetota bacterium]|nr:two-component system, OmpR family, sensor kinase [Actinomycetota bacterium]